MKTKLMLLLIIMTSFLTGCNKDDEQAYYPVNPIINNYTFLNDTIEITNAEYGFTNGDTFLQFHGESVDDYVYITFANRTGIVPIGSYTYHVYPNSGYVVESNFSRGAISHPSDQLDFYANSGTITIAKESNGMYKVSFLLVTDNSTAKGDYTGVINLSN